MAGPKPASPSPAGFEVSTRRSAPAASPASHRTCAAAAPPWAPIAAASASAGHCPLTARGTPASSRYPSSSRGVAPHPAAPRARSRVFERPPAPRRVPLRLQDVRLKDVDLHLAWPVGLRQRASQRRRAPRRTSSGRRRHGRCVPEGCSRSVGPSRSRPASGARRAGSPSATYASMRCASNTARSAGVFASAARASSTSPSWRRGSWPRPRRRPRSCRRPLPRRDPTGHRRGSARLGIERNLLHSPRQTGGRGPRGRPGRRASGTLQPEQPYVRERRARRGSSPSRRRRGRRTSASSFVA